MIDGGVPEQTRDHLPQITSFHTGLVFRRLELDLKGEPLAKFDSEKYPDVKERMAWQVLDKIKHALPPSPRDNKLRHLQLANTVMGETLDRIITINRPFAETLDSAIMKVSEKGDWRIQTALQLGAAVYFAAWLARDETTPRGEDRFATRLKAIQKPEDLRSFVNGFEANKPKDLRPNPLQDRLYPMPNIPSQRSALRDLMDGTLWIMDYEYRKAYWFGGTASDAGLARIYPAPLGQQEEVVLPSHLNTFLSQVSRGLSTS
jgi:hypothetical protein